MIARLSGALMFVLLTIFPAHAATIETEIVRGEFIAEHSNIAPGGESTIALDMALKPGWHTYWKNAGDSGQPIEVKWTAPAGVILGDIEWPAPHRQPYAPLMNYGYEDAATLLMPVRLSADWPEGKPIDLKAEVYWLVCNEVCIPEQGETTFQFKSGASTTLDHSVSDLFMKARAATAQPNPYDARHQIDDSFVKMRFDSTAFAEGNVADAYFFPAEWGVIDHAAMQVATIDKDGLTLAIPRSPENEEIAKGPLNGILEITEKAPDGQPLRVALAVDSKQGVVSGSAASYRGAAGSSITLPLALAFAFLGGVILNLMPCVFPVLALKALGFAQTAGEAHSKRVAHGIAYTFGVLVLFGVLAAVFLTLKSAGMAIGWGFQLQNPLIVAGLAYLLFAVGLNLSGVFEVNSQLSGLGSDAASGGGLRGAFFTGALAAVVATPCTAPFMATAMGATLTMDAPSTIAVFLMLGVGLAAPFLLLSLMPGAARWMPAPGPWMVRMKEFLAFPMYASAAWLVWVLGALAGADAVLAALIGGVLIGFAAWAVGVGQSSGRRGQLIGFSGAVVALAGALALGAHMRPLPEGAAAVTVVEGPGEAFTSARLAALRAKGEPVFINMTADWCITCKVNERVALGSAFETALTENGVTYLKGDWTARDPEITALLERFGRAGVPLYAVFPRKGEPTLLPQILTRDMIVDALGRV